MMTTDPSGSVPVDFAAAAAVRPGCAELRLRPPQLTDGKAIWQLVKDSGVLDPNSPYCYLLLGYHFAGTSLVADANGRIAGFVYAYLPPERPRTVFVWQVGVDATWRGRGLGARLLHAVLEREACRNVTFLEATVGPGNAASLALFRGVAGRLGAQVAELPCFGSELFPGARHEEERLVRIGPFAPVVTEHNAARAAMQTGECT